MMKIKQICMRILVFFNLLKEESMLILSRHFNESIVIGDDIRIRVLGIRGNQVRIGISAPKEVSVDREEIYLKKRAELESEEED